MGVLYYHTSLLIQFQHIHIKPLLDQFQDIESNTLHKQELKFELGYFVILQVTKVC